MKKALSIILKVIKWIIIVLAAIIVIALIVRFIGCKVNASTPSGGISEEKYIDVNGQQQWVSIYGENKDNPVMIYLHGGPGNSTSYADWAIIRRLCDDYTVVCWDQRNCGKTWINDPKDDAITPELMRSDLEILVDEILKETGKEKITLLGMSWGTYYGCDYALSHPAKVECIINLSQCVDEELSSLGLKEEYLKLTENDPELHKLAEEYDPLLIYNLTDSERSDFEKWTKTPPEQRAALVENNPRLKEIIEELKKQSGIVMQLSPKYMPEEESVFDSDTNMIAAVFFNPYYSLSELYKVLHYNYDEAYGNFNHHDFYVEFSLKDKKEYKMPIYVMQGDQDDYGSVVKDYMESVKAPDKEFRYIKGGHMSTMLKSDELDKFVHEMYERQQTAKEN